MILQNSLVTVHTLYISDNKEGINSYGDLAANDVHGLPEDVDGDEESS